jgi:predicted CxxxxCH...CXXCH cytochrome family protein
MKTHGRGWRFIRAFGVILPLMLMMHAGEPVQAADVHSIHTSDTVERRSCWDCHDGMTHSATGGNLTVDVPTSADTFEFKDYFGNFESDTGTLGEFDGSVCSNVDCHAGATNTGTTTVIGGGETPLKCGACHPGAADVDDFSFFDGTMAKISSAEWLASGHGAGAAFAGPADDPSGCAYCHDLVVNTNNSLTDHNTPTNPFRLANENILTGGWNDLCLVCHSGGDAGYDPDEGAGGYDNRGAGLEGTAVDQDHNGLSHISAADGGKFCWDCHDPHGDQNVFMVQNAVTAASDGTYGIPTPTGTRPVDFTTTTVPGNLNTTGYYVNTSTIPNATGVCQACHTNDAGFTGEARFWRSDGSEDADGDGTNDTVTTRHNEDVSCSICHNHDNADSGFKAACTDCHGNSATGALWPDSLSNNPYRQAAFDEPEAPRSRRRTTPAGGATPATRPPSIPSTPSRGSSRPSSSAWTPPATAGQARPATTTGRTTAAPRPPRGLPFTSRPSGAPTTWTPTSPSKSPPRSAPVSTSTATATSPPRPGTVTRISFRPR